jgi:CheY-like chemotaxis protein
MTDQGGGIDPKIINKLFDPYFSTKQVGSGLGLTTAYAIIKNHGGYLTVASEAGVGATFIIYLPALETGEPEPQAAVLPEKGQGRILVMDDEAPVRQMLGKMLTKLGYDAVFATNGREALEIYRQAGDAGQPFAAAILDLTIPGGMGGKDAIKQLQKLDPHVKAIVSSGYADDPIMAAFAKYGFRGVIAKPYKIEDLSRVLAEIIQKTPDSEKSG